MLVLHIKVSVGSVYSGYFITGFSQQIKHPVFAAQMPGAYSEKCGLTFSILRHQRNPVMIALVQ